MNKRIKRGLFTVLAFVVASGILFPSGVMAGTDADAALPAGLSESPVVLDGEDSVAEETIESLEENRGAVLFADLAADGSGGSEDRVKLSYSEKLRHENWFTRFFTVEYDGKTKIAYCIEPKEYPPEKGEQPAVLFDDGLMEKAIYYSYGYPGYETVTKPYLEKCSMASCYEGTDGAYILSHIMLSYLYDNEDAASDAFRGISGDTKQLIIGMVKNLKEKWPDVPEDASLELDVTVAEAEWNKDDQQQETAVMKLKGNKDNYVVVTVPEDAVMIKLSGDVRSEHGEGSVEVHGGDEFFFTAGASKTGTYESGLLQGCLQDFQPYMIQVSGKQDIMYAGDGEPDEVSFKIIWENIGKLRLKKISAAPEITESSDKYSLKDAVYGIYNEDGELVDEIITDEEGLAEILLPYGSYILQELKSPIGYLLDPETYEISIAAGEAVFEHEEKPVPEEPAPPEDTPQTGDELPQRLLLAIVAGSIAVMTMIAAVLGSRVFSGRGE